VQNQGAEGGGGVSDEAKRDALAGASNNVNPTQTVQQNTEQQQPPSRQPGADVTNTQGPRPPTGTVVIVIRRPQ
jgi:hypothetical protein